MNREARELRRDRIRLTLAGLGSAILMFVLGYGISMDVENLSFAVLDRDNTSLSRDYADALAGSRYFTEQPPAADEAEIDRRMREGRAEPRPRDPRGLRAPRRTWRAGGDRRVDRRRDAAAGTDRHRLRAGHAPALADGARPRGARRCRARGGLPHRDPLPLQPERPQPERHRAGDDPAAAAADPGHPLRARGGAREGAGLHRQSLRHAGDAPGVPARQAAPVHRGRDG